MKRTSTTAYAYLGLLAATALPVLATGLVNWEVSDPIQFTCYLVATLLASGLRVNLPGISETMSVNYIFILMGVIDLSLSEILLIGCLAAVVQAMWRPARRPTWFQVVSSVSSMAIAIAAADLVCHSPLANVLDNIAPLMLAVVACIVYSINTISVAVAISVTEERSPVKVWRECYLWALPYYLVGASFTGLVTMINEHLGWQTWLLTLPAVYVIHRSYRLPISRLESKKKHAESVMDIYLRTIETLALAIEAKDEITHQHLERVQRFAVEVGKEMRLSDTDLRALRAAAILHDIGKLAVPEHIISKPGKLTPEEFEEMKIHPTVGAEILEQVQFPYPVAPIVRAHHEKWDGSGYPLGLKGEDIPLTARILAAVDCLDALTSHRPYRPALPLDRAVQVVVSESGKSYDPQVAAILKQRYRELDSLARLQPANGKARLATSMRTTLGRSPAAGFEKTSVPAPQAEVTDRRLGVSSCIAAVRQEVQMLLELSHELGSSLSLHETLSVLDHRLARMISYDTIAVHILREDQLVPGYVNGEDARLLSSMEIPIGHGLCGWVVRNARPIVNGDPSLEPWHLCDSKEPATMQSALAVPLQELDKVVGVLTVYRRGKDAFNREDLRILMAISSRLSMAVVNALRYRQAEMLAGTDGLTGLPNARSLFLHLDAELERCRRATRPLAVFVCDLDGFKQVNDHFGHLEGNKVLTRVAKGLKDTCRKYDYVARMGGDEFVLVLPGVQTDEVAGKVEKLSRIVNEAGRQVCGEEPLSASIGVALYPEQGGDAEDLLAEADRRMYKAKHWSSVTAFDLERPDGLDALATAVRQPLAPAGGVKPGVSPGA